MVRTSLKLLFLSSVIVLIILIVWLFGLTVAIIGLAVSFIPGILIIIYMDRIILRIYKAHPVLAGEYSGIREKIRVLSEEAGVAVPSIYITGLPLPGSFIIGKGMDKTSLVLPARLPDLLDDKELEAMLAYNIVQINNTLRLRTIVALITGILVMAASAVRWGAVFTGFGDYNDPAPRLFGAFIIGLAAPPAATMIHSVSTQDYDMKAAELCGNPDALISAIERLENSKATGYPSLGFLCLVDPQKETFFEHLFDTHPPKEIRIKNLIKTGRIA